MAYSRIKLLLIGALMGVGCQSHDDNVSSSSSTVESQNELGRGGGPSLPSSSFIVARNRVAEVRCDRMATCGVVGDGQVHSSLGACLAAEKTRVEGWWGDNCPNASLDSVTACIADIAGDFCPASTDRVFVRLAGACAATHVCGPS